MTIYQQILYVQSFSACFSVLGLVSAGQLWEALGFISRHPEALSSILALSAAATVGQLFISHTIRTYGALVFATVMTTRWVGVVRCTSRALLCMRAHGEEGPMNKRGSPSPGSAFAAASLLRPLSHTLVQAMVCGVGCGVALPAGTRPC